MSSPSTEPTSTGNTNANAADAGGRDMFFKATPTATEASSTATGSSSTYNPPQPPARPPRKYIDKEDLNQSVYAAALAESSDGTLKHFSRLEDTPDTTNPVTGKSVYFGLFPWRCSDRVSDWRRAISNFDGPRKQLHHFRLLRQCSRSALGDEPLDDYAHLPLAQAIYFKERASAGMMRERFWGRYPFELRDIKRLGEADGVRMRTWRQQRHLEEVARNDQIDDLIKASVVVSNRSTVERLDDAANPYTSGTQQRK